MRAPHPPTRPAAEDSAAEGADKPGAGRRARGAGEPRARRLCSGTQTTDRDADNGEARHAYRMMSDQDGDGSTDADEPRAEGRINVNLSAETKHPAAARPKSAPPPANMQTHSTDYTRYASSQRSLRSRHSLRS